MVEYSNDCYGCAVPEYPCRGEACPLRHAKHLYCDQCDEEVEELYIHNELQLCQDCLLKQFERID